MAISITTARRIAAEYASSMSDFLARFASTTARAISDAEFTPMAAEIRDEIENAAIVGDEVAVRQLRRLEDYVADEAMRRGVRIQ